MIVLLLVAGFGYFAVYRPVQNFLAGFGAPAQTQTAAQEAQAQAAQAQRPLTTADVQRFVRVRRSVRTAMGDSFGSVERLFGDLQNGQSPSAVAVLGVLRDATGSVGTARSAQQAALAREGMSTARYTYVRGEVNKALGLPQIDFQKVARSVSQGQLPDLNTSVQTGDASNQKLVTPFRSELTVTAPLGLLGL